MQKTSTNEHTLGAATEGFTFDTLVGEVDAIVEDLRWLHLELTLRNRLGEILFEDRTSVYALIRHTFAGLCQRLSAYEMIIFVRETLGFNIALHEAQNDTPWGTDRTPWIDAVDRWIDSQPRDASIPQAIINHYTIDVQPVTAIAMPVRVGRTYLAFMLVVLPTSNLVPRVRKLLAGLSGSLGLSMQYCRDADRRGRDNAPPMRTPTHQLGSPAAPIPHIPSFDGALVVQLDADHRITAINDTFADLLGLRASRAVGVSFAELALTESERRLLRNSGSELDRGAGSIQLFRVRTADGTSIPTLWIVAGASPAMTPAGGIAAAAGGIAMQAGESRLPAGGSTTLVEGGTTSVDGSTVPADKGTPPSGGFEIPAGESTPSVAVASVHTLIGTRVAPDMYEILSEQRSTGRDADLFAARLAKQYRFLMKYVPFPIIHLDVEADIIRNANPAFAALLGPAQWEGIPLSDFGTLSIQEGPGDARACTLFLVTEGGITITCRGIITTLLLFGKPVREIKLDPIASREAAPALT